MYLQIGFIVKYRKPLARAYDFLHLIFFDGFSIRAARIASRSEKIPTWTIGFDK